MKDLEYRKKQEELWAPFNHDRGYNLLVKVTKLLDSAGIPYHLEGGTLLGLVRDGELMSWDDDMDISVPFEFINKVRRALVPLFFSGWRVDVRRWKLFSEYGFSGPRIIKVRDRSRGLFRSGRVYLDIISKVKKDGYCYWEAKERLMRVDDKYYFGCDYISVNGDTFKVPKNYKDYLSEKYGDWSIPVKEWDCSSDEKTIFK